MTSATLVIPGRLDTRTGGYIYDRRMVEGLRQRGWTVDVVELDSSFPYPTPAALEGASRLFAHVAGGSTVLVDSLALGAMPDVIVREGPRLRIVALVHLPLAADVGLDRATALHFEEGERRALQAAALVVVTGRATCSLLTRYELSHDRVVVIEPGTDRAPLARGSAGAEVQLLCAGTLNPGKAHEVLLRALAAVPDRRWRLTCAGSLTRDPGTVEHVRAAISQLELEDRVSLTGDLDGPALDAAYDGADLFVLATRQETYGMAVAEALARGLPVVSTSTGAIPELVRPDAGIVVPVGDLAALTAALSRAIADREYRARLAAGARLVRDRLPTWEQASARLADVLAGLRPPPPS
jgi:glycosyltransferase involved in cell wall biosynthesis